MSQDRETTLLTAPLGDFGSNNKRPYNRLLDSGFGLPQRGASRQTAGKFGYNKSAGTHGPVRKGSNMTEMAESMKNEIKHQTEKTVSELLRNGPTPDAFAGAVARAVERALEHNTTHMATAVAAVLEDHTAKREKEEAQKAEAMAKIFRHNRWEKLENTGFQAAGVAVGLTVGGLATLGLKKVLGL